MRLFCIALFMALLLIFSIVIVQLSATSILVVGIGIILCGVMMLIGQWKGRDE